MHFWVIVPERIFIYIFFLLHSFRFITCVICSPVFTIACNILHCLLLRNKKVENERIICWIIAGLEQKTYTVPHVLTTSTWYCHFYAFSPCLSTINKRNMNLIAKESELQFHCNRLWCAEEESMNISCWSGLFNCL